MKIVYVIQDLTPTAGTTVFCEAVCDCQTASGHICAIATIANYASYKLADWDVVHMHGLWSPFNVRVMRDCLAQGIPFVVSIHGCLMPRVFTKGRLKKFVFWHFLLKPLLKKANAIHCTSESEKEACVKLGLPGPFIIAPLGVNLPELKPCRGGDVENEVEARVPSRPQRNILFLGRLSEEKGLLNLLEAWESIDHEGWTLKIAGPDWHGYKKKLDDKIEAEKIGDVEFPGLVQGEAKDKLYREADIFVLPSPMENFSMVVLDALAYGIPIIATKGTPWQELEGNIRCSPSPSPSSFTSANGRCGLWIDQGVEPLKAALVQLLNLPTSQLRALGANGRALAERKYQWPTIAQSLITCYQEICK